jgi:hypothetical protein
MGSLAYKTGLKRQNGFTLTTRVQILSIEHYSRLRKSSYWACEPIQNQ